MAIIEEIEQQLESLQTKRRAWQRAATDATGHETWVEASLSIGYSREGE